MLPVFFYFLQFHAQKIELQLTVFHQHHSTDDGIKTNNKPRFHLGQQPVEVAHAHAQAMHCYYCMDCIRIVGLGISCCYIMGPTFTPKKTFHTIIITIEPWACAS
jgi:hypothetical protein